MTGEMESCRRELVRINESEEVMKYRQIRSRSVNHAAWEVCSYWCDKTARFA